MRRRRFLKGAAALGATPFWPTVWSSTAPAAGGGGNRPFSRVRPGDAAWPSEASWNELSRNVGGRLVRVRSPLAECTNAPMAVTCSEVFANLKNPYYLGDDVGLTQSLGWTDAWTSQPSAYAVAAESAQDVVAAVNFANANNLRLVVKGGGHSYKGTSNAAELIANLAATDERHHRA